MLEEPERHLFRRLSLFAGGFEIEAAETVGTGNEVGPEVVLDLLSGLVDKSLVVADDDGDVLRYRMLKPVRQYGIERLEESGEADAARDRHAALFVALAERAIPSLGAPAR
jgi:predicted ATPase